MALIAIIGSGVVGEATGKAFARLGHTVIFSDVNEAKLESLRKEGHRSCRPEALEHEPVDAFFVAVPTPQGEDGTVNLSYIRSSVKALGLGPLRHLKTYPIVVMKCTLPPGTISEIIIPLLEDYSGKRAGTDFGVIAEPEYLREKTAIEDAESPRLIVAGSHDPRAAHFLEWIRQPFHCPFIHMNTEEAEIQKYVHNLFNATKISFFNDLRPVCERLKNVDCEHVFQAAMETAEGSWNHAYGTRDMGPFGGSCLPKDTIGFLRWSQEKFSLTLPLLESVIAVNKITEKRKGGKTNRDTPLLDRGSHADEPARQLATASGTPKGSGLEDIREQLKEA